MPSYSGTYATPRLDLGVAMQEYMESADEFIGTQILPVFKTTKKAATFSKISRAGFLRRSNVKRAARAAYSRDEASALDQSYNCEEYGHEQPLDDSERELYASDFDAEEVAAKHAMRRVLQEQEIRIAGLLFNTGTFTGSTLATTVSTAWSTTTSTIVADVLAAKDKVRDLTGMLPNVLILPYAALRYMLINEQIRVALNYTTLPTIDALKAALPALFDVEKVLVGKGIYNSADEGQTFAKADIWNAGYAMVACVAGGSSLAEPGIGRTMLWVNDSAENIMVEQYREEQTRSEVFRSRQHVDEILWDPSYAHLIDIAP